MYKEMKMTRPETPYEAASYDLNKFRERRLADRRFNPRTTEDRRQSEDPMGAGRADKGTDPAQEQESRPN